jgi:hypothetical protein
MCQKLPEIHYISTQPLRKHNAMINQDYSKLLLLCINNSSLLIQTTVSKITKNTLYLHEVGKKG